MASEKVTVTFDSVLLEMIRESADSAGQSVSGWLASAARNRLREQGAADLAQWLHASRDGREAVELARSASRRAADKFDRRSSAA